MKSRTILIVDPSFKHRHHKAFYIGKTDAVQWLIACHRVNARVARAAVASTDGNNTIHVRADNGEIVSIV